MIIGAKVGLNPFLHYMSFINAILSCTKIGQKTA